MLLDMLNPQFAAAQQVPKDDKRLKTEYVEYPSPQGNTGKTKGYLVRPANATGKLPAILVDPRESRAQPAHRRHRAPPGARQLHDLRARRPGRARRLPRRRGQGARASFPQLDAAKTREDMVAATTWLKGRPDSTGPTRIGSALHPVRGRQRNPRASSRGVELREESPRLVLVARVSTQRQRVGCEGHEVVERQPRVRCADRDSRGSRGSPAAAGPCCLNQLRCCLHMLWQARRQRTWCPSNWSTVQEFLLCGRTCRTGSDLPTMLLTAVDRQHAGSSSPSAVFVCTHAFCAQSTTTPSAARPGVHLALGHGVLSGLDAGAADRANLMQVRRSDLRHRGCGSV